MATGDRVGSGTIAVGSNQLGCTINPAGTRAYVSNYGSGTISVINIASGTVIASPSISSPWGMATSPDGTKLYVSTQYGNLNVFDTSTNTLSTTFTQVYSGGGPGVAVTPDGSKIVVTNYSTSNVSVFTSSGTRTDISTPTGTPCSVVISSNGRYAYVSNQGTGNGTIYVIDLQTLSVSSSFNITGTMATGIALSPDNTKLYVYGSSNNCISVCSLNGSGGGSETCYWTVGYAQSTQYSGSQLAISPDGTMLYIACSSGIGLVPTDNPLTTQSTGAYAWLAPYTLGLSTYGVSVNPSNGNVMGVLAAYNAVAFVEGAPSKDVKTYKTVTARDTASGGLPLHQTGDLLIAVNVNSQFTVPAGWTTICNYSTTWAYDSMTVAYKIAQSSSEISPNSGGGAWYAMSLYNYDKTTPLSYSTNTSSSAPQPLPLLSTANSSSLSLYAAAGYAGGGNPPGINITAWPYSKFTPVIGSNRAYIGYGSGTNYATAYSVGGYGFGSVRWVEVVVNAEAVQSGFFSMF